MLSCTRGATRAAPPTRNLSLKVTNTTTSRSRSSCFLFLSSPSPPPRRQPCRPCIEIEEKSMETPIPMEEKEKILEKRSRKRSRYLSPPYTFPFTDTHDVAVSVSCHGHGSDQSDDLTNVAVADMLSALHAAALLDMDAANAAAGVDLLRRFFTLHKTTSPSSSATRVNAQAELNPSGRSRHKEETTSKTNKMMMKKKKAAAAASTPTSRLPLTDVRNNLEKMISSLLGRSPTATPTATTSHDHGATLALAGEMRGLLAKVDKMLSATTPAHRH